jgi:hypothetical protein
MFAALLLRQRVHEEACRLPEDVLSGLYVTLMEGLRLPQLPHGVAEPVCEALAHIIIVWRLDLKELRKYLLCVLILKSGALGFNGHHRKIWFPRTVMLPEQYGCRGNIASSISFTSLATSGRRCCPSGK